MSQTPERRRPRVFSADDPHLDLSVEPEARSDAVADELAGTAGTGRSSASDEAGEQGELGKRATAADKSSAIGWGGILVSALTGLVTLGIGAWFARLVSAALDRADWVGWTAYGLLIVAAIAAGALVLKELFGFARLSRLTHLKRDVIEAVATRDAKAERSVVKRVKDLYVARPESRWGVKRFSEHEKDVHDPGALLALAERDLVAPLDGEARRAILTSAKRVSVVTAMSPLMAIAVIYVLVENLRMLRGLAALYGGRPGLLGALKLGRMVITHIIATGGIAMTDDLIGQFVGQDLVRRLSRRLGEGLFNGALTARIGAAAIEVCRPLPFIEAKPIRVRDLVSELARRSTSQSEEAERAARETGRRID